MSSESKQKLIQLCNQSVDSAAEVKLCSDEQLFKYRQTAFIF